MTKKEKTKNVMKEQWDRISSENAFFGVLSRNEFEDPHHINTQKFWETGRKDVGLFLKIVGLEDTEPLSMVEIGCGLGRMTHAFAELFGKVYAFDVSSEMLSRAQSHWGILPNVEWVLGNGEDLHQVPDRSVDFVFSFLVLQHVPKSDTVLNYIRETERILKPDGVAVLQFRMLPRRLGLPALKYHISTYWPPFVEASLRRVWDFVNGYQGTKAKFTRQYESWRGCALKPGTVEALAAEIHLQVENKGKLGVQSSGTHSMFYVFRKAAESAGTAPL